MWKKLVIIYVVTVVVLLALMIFAGVGWANTAIQLKTQTQLAKTQQIKIKVADFLKLFIAKVLKNHKEIIFEERLQLENAVLDLEDPQILDQWHKFTGSETEEEAQQATIALLELLAEKIDK